MKMRLAVLSAVLLISSNMPVTYALSDFERGYFWGCTLTDIRAGLLLGAAMLLTPTVCQLAKIMVRHKYAATTVLTGVALCAIPQARRIILSKLEERVPFFVPVCERVKHIAKTIGIWALAAKYKITTFGGLTINRPTENCSTMLYNAISYGKTMAAIALIKAGADPKDQSSITCAVSLRNVDVVSALLKANANPNGVTHYGGISMLHLAVGPSSKDEGVVRLLLGAHANPNVREESGETPLHRAAAWCNPIITQDLIDAGADLNVYCQRHVYPLYEAVRYRAFRGDVYDKQLRTISILLKAGARQFVHSPNFNLNADKRDVQVLKDCLSRAIQNRDKTLLGALLEVGMSAIALDANGSTIMHQVIGAYNAAEPTDLDSLAKEIIRVHGQAAIHVRDQVGRTPLHLAAQYGNLRLAKLLLRNGALVNAQDNAGNSPLHYIENSLRMRDLLVMHGADISLLNNNDESPIRYKPALWDDFFRERFARPAIS